MSFSDVIIGTMASQITSFTIVYSIIYQGADQRKHQISASLAFVRGIHRSPVNSLYKWTVTRKMFPLNDVIIWLHVFVYTRCCWWEPRAHQQPRSRCGQERVDSTSRQPNCGTGQSGSREHGSIHCTWSELWGVCHTHALWKRVEFAGRPMSGPMYNYEITVVSVILRFNCQNDFRRTSTYFNINFM